MSSMYRRVDYVYFRSTESKATSHTRLEYITAIARRVKKSVLTKRIEFRLSAVLFRAGLQLRSIET